LPNLRKKTTVCGRATAEHEAVARRKKKSCGKLVPRVARTSGRSSQGGGMGGAQGEGAPGGGGAMQYRRSSFLGTTWETREMGSRWKETRVGGFGQFFVIDYFRI
jgi:hypothetical protein